MVSHVAALSRRGDDTSDSVAAQRSPERTRLQRRDMDGVNRQPASLEVIRNHDCSPDHRLRGLEYALWLKDPLSLYGSNAQLAPGYEDPRGESEKTVKAL